LKEYPQQKVSEETKFDNFLQKLRAISSIERTAGSHQPLLSRTADTIATIEDVVQVKLQMLYRFRGAFIPVSWSVKLINKYRSYSEK